MCQLSSELGLAWLTVDYGDEIGTVAPTVPGWKFPNEGSLDVRG